MSFYFGPAISPCRRKKKKKLSYSVLPDCQFITLLYPFFLLRFKKEKKKKSLLDNLSIFYKFKLIVSLNISNIFLFHSPLTFVMPVFRSFANDL